MPPPVSALLPVAPLSGGAVAVAAACTSWRQRNRNRRFRVLVNTGTTLCAMAGRIYKSGRKADGRNISHMGPTPSALSSTRTLCQHGVRPGIASLAPAARDARARRSLRATLVLSRGTGQRSSNAFAASPPHSKHVSHTRGLPPASDTRSQLPKFDHS